MSGWGRSVRNAFLYPAVNAATRWGLDKLGGMFRGGNSGSKRKSFKRRTFKARPKGPRRVEEGVQGYGSRRVAYKTGHRRGWKRRMKKSVGFKRRVLKALESTLLEQQNLIIQSAQRLVTGAIGNTAGGGALNRQGYGQIIGALTYTDLNSIFTKIGTSVGGGPALTGKGMKFTINSYYVRTMMKNMSNVTSFVDVYEVIPRNDTQVAAVTAFQTGMTDQNSTNTDLICGVTPFQCNYFCTLYKILRKTRYILAPGAMEITEYRDRKPKVIDWERIQTLSATASAGFRGLSKFWIAIVQSEPSDDSAVVTQITPSLGVVNFTELEIYEYSYAFNNAVKTDLIDNTTVSSTAARTCLLETGVTGTAITSS